MTRKTGAAAVFTLGTLTVAMLLSGSCGGAGKTQSASSKTDSRSVIVVAVDGLRADALGCYGGSANTPALDALAGESIRFDQVWAQAPEMLPSLATMLTALYPTSHGLVLPGDRLVPEANTLAESLSTAGLATAAFIQGKEGGDAFGLDQGFGSYSVGSQPGVAGLTWLNEHADHDVFLLIAGWSVGQLESVKSDPELQAPEGFTQRLQEALSSQDSDTLTEADVAYAKLAYSAHVTRIDRAIGELIESLRSQGHLDKATFVLVGTSGFALQEHGDLVNNSLYPAVTRVPLMIRIPNGSPTTVGNVVEVLDLMPTLIEATGALTPDGIQGSSLMRIVDGTSNPPYIAFSEADFGGGMTSVVMNGMQLITAGEQSSLYDLKADPMAQTDLSAEYPERAAVLAEHLGAWSKMVSAASLDPERKTEELDDDTLDQLRSLGYIQ